MKNVSRRGFVAGSAVTAGLAGLGLAGCGSSASNESSSTSAFEAPALDKYPIEPDGSDVEALWTSEETRDGWTKVTNPEGGVTIGVMDTAKIIQVDGLAFRDMNGDGKLEAWEDWRQDADTRAQALAESLTAEDIYPLLWAGGTQSDSTSTDTSAMDWVQAGSRAGVSRLSSSIDSYATDIAWINQVEELCEQSELGIPYLNYSDPYVIFDLPSSFGLSTIMDKDVWRQAGMWQARAWRATGVRCELGPQIDVYSNPIGTRLSGSVSEDPALNRDFIQAFGAGMQSTWGDDEATDDQGWGDDSCGVMLKHFVGEGSNEGGRDDHVDTGKWDVFPGSNFNAHLIPFLDGGLNLDSKTGSAVAVMPNYGIAYDPNDGEALGEHVGSSYSEHNMNILKNAGFDGMIVTDWLILNGIPNGVRDLTTEQRFAKMLKNGICQHGGSFQPDDVAAPTYELLKEELGEDDALALLQDAARRFFKVEVTVNLFDQPYSDRTAAKEILENENAAAFGLSASEKSIVMVKNSDSTISKDGLSGKVYIPAKYTAAVAGTFGTTPASAAQSFGEGLELGFDVVTDTVGDPTGPAGDDGAATLQESDIKTLTADDLKDVKYAVVGISNPDDTYQGVTNGPSFMTTFIGGHGDEPYEGAVYKPLSLQYRPFTADGDYVRKESLNPVDEWGKLENRSVYGESTFANNESDLDLVIAVKEKLPADAKLICVVTVDRPMVFSELEPYCDAILLNFGGVTEQAVANILSGSVEPSGLLSFQQPASMQTVFEQNEDVPRDMDCYTDADGNTYDFCFGLNWSGVIDDDRVKTYSADPLTDPETEVNPEAKA